MKRFKKYWWLLILIVVAPIIINYALLIPAFGPVVGDNVHWLSFWGSYLAALVSFIILFIQREDNHKENKQNRQLQINVLKYQQEMQWLNENKNILLDFVLLLHKNDLIQLMKRMSEGQNISDSIKQLMERFIAANSKIAFMCIPVQSDEFNAFLVKREDAYKTYRSIILDVQEINLIFSKPLQDRKRYLTIRMQNGSISNNIKDIVDRMLSIEVFVSQDPAYIMKTLIDKVPNLFMEVKQFALTYIRSEEERIAKILSEDN